mgnify:CR=1 FL=1
MGNFEISMMCKYKNNPLNIRFSASNHWQGLEGERRGFCEFSTLSYGIRAAAIILMQSYRKQGFDKLHSLIRRWAPPEENPTEEYLKFVRTKTVIWSDEALRQPSQYALIIWAMAWFEQGCKPAFSPAEVLKVINYFKITLQ